MVLSFGHTMLAATHSRPAKVPKPQSVDAMTRSRSPIAATASSMRRATTSGCSTKFEVELDHARDQDLVLRERMRLERRIFVLVARVGELDRQRARGRLVEHRQHLGERDVIDMRAFPVAPADVQPPAVCRNAFAGLVDRREMHLGDLDESLVGLVLEIHHAFHREIGRVDLQHQAGLVDGEVLLAKLHRERVHVGFVRVVMRIHQRSRYDAGRRRGHELLGEGIRRVFLEARDLVLDRSGVGVFHVCDRLRRVGNLGAVHEAAAERRDQIGVLDEILADAALALAAVAGHARRHVGLERDALLLAIVTDVDAGILLPLHHLGDRAVEFVRHFLRIDLPVCLALDQKLGDRLVARQAADMRGQDAVAAGEHFMNSPRRTRAVCRAPPCLPQDRSSSQWRAETRPAASRAEWAACPRET